MKVPVCDLPFVTVPTPIIDKGRVRTNILRMLEKANRSGVAFRPHFKTHQSIEIGRWFRETGVDRIAVSSLRMADVFAADGWTDILVAFPFNIREWDTAKRIGAGCHLQLLVDHGDTVRFLMDHVDDRLDVWIKVDTGYGRSGVRWDHPELTALARQIVASANLRLAGLLAHGGHSYHATEVADIRRIAQETRTRMTYAKQTLTDADIPVHLVSVGDTPGCSLAEVFTGLDEIRPGNFVFHDLMQWKLGSCTESDLAMALACPVVGVYPDRNEVVILGGAVHFSKERLSDSDGEIFGLGVQVDRAGFGPLVPDIRITGLSQEHGIVKLPSDACRGVRVGDVLTFVPVHSCLTADQYDHYRTPGGSRIDRINSVSLRS